MLKKTQRLTKKQLAYVFRKGKKFGNTYFNIRFIKNIQPFSRFSPIVSPKILKKAVERNQLKRRMYEIIRLNIDALPKKYDIAVIAKSSVIALNFENLKKTMLYILKTIY